MLVAAAVLPHPPLIVPAVGVGLGPEIDALRRDCAEAVAELFSRPADVRYVVGAGLGRPAFSFAPWAPGAAGGAERVDIPEPLPLPLLVGGWLTRGRSRSFVVVDPGTDAEGCTRLGAELAASADRVGLLAMGDGSARHDAKAPGYVDVRAADWDRAAHEAFATGDAAGLAGLDAGLGDELMCAGRAPWQVLAGAATGVSVTTMGAKLLVTFGVGYHVVRWTAGNEASAEKG